MRRIAFVAERRPAILEASAPYRALRLLRPFARPAVPRRKQTRDRLRHEPIDEGLAKDQLAWRQPASDNPGFDGTESCQHFEADACNRVRVIRIASERVENGLAFQVDP